MKTNHVKNEAVGFVMDLLFSRVCVEWDKEDNVWEEILKKVKEDDWKRSHSWPYSLPPAEESPFIQGDDSQNGLPDIVYEGNSFVVGIEHFQFDSSGKNRKGSRMNLAEIKAAAENTKKAHNLAGQPIVTDTTVEVEFSYEGYVQSLLTVFTAHAAQIPKYRTALEAKYVGKKIYLGFYLDDITSIGSYIKDANTIQPMIPFKVREFLDALSTVTGLDFMACRYQEVYVYYLNILQLNTKTINQLYEHVYDMDKFQYVSYHYKQQLRRYRMNGKSSVENKED